MEQKELKRQIFDEELLKLYEKGYIPQMEYLNISDAYNKYYYEQDRKEISQISHPEKKEAVKKDSITISVNKEELPKREKVALSQQDLRERNITWSLNLGVIFILIAGLVIATSNWRIMSSLTKTSLILLVSILFFIVSYLADTVLKISRTSFAFWVLGSLMLPVSVLSLGYFRLLGEWLSITGGGRYILGLLGATVCLPVYVFSTYKYKHRAFSWISLITLSLDVLFLLKAVELPLDVFFFGIILYNAFLLACFVKIKNNKLLDIFVKELDLFAQVNLILSTIFIVGFHKNQSFYGFNIILTSLIYVVMLYYKKAKEFSFPFSILLVYGIYQIIESTSLISFDFILFSCIGMIFLAAAGFFKDAAAIRKIFHYISGFVSAGSFIYSTFIFLQMSYNGISPSLMTLSYFFTAINYIILSKETGNRIFSLLAAVFLITAGEQSHLIFSKYITSTIKDVYIFTVPVAAFIILFCKNKWSYLQSIKSSIAAVAVADLLLKLVQALAKGEFLKCSICFFILGGMFLTVYLCNKKNIIGGVIRWTIPIAFFSGTAILYGWIDRTIVNESVYPLILHLWLSSVFITLISIILKKFNSELEAVFLIVANGMLSYFIIGLLLFYNKPVVFIVSAAIYAYCVYKYKANWQKLMFMSFFFMTAALALNAVFNVLGLGSDIKQYVLLITSLIIAVLCFFAKNKWKTWLFINLIPFSTISSLVLIWSSAYNFNGFIGCLIIVAVMLYAIYQSKESFLNIIPLSLICMAVYRLNLTITKDWQMLLIYLVLFALLCTAGQLLYNKLYITEEENKIFNIAVDWYTVFAFVSIMLMYNNIEHGSKLYFKLLPAVLIVYILFCQIKRVEMDIDRKIVTTIALLSTLVPYYTIVCNIEIPEVIKRETVLLPAIPFVMVLTRKLWSDSKESFEMAEYIVLAFVAAVLLRDSITSGDIRDGMILGAAALSSVITGMQLKIKSFFFAGAVTLLLNLIIQTRSFWESLPWWSYLLIVGLILIIVASLNELQSNKNNQNKKINKEKIKNLFKNWR